MRSWTTEANTGGTWTQTDSKTNHYDSDDDSPRWITEDSVGNLTRSVDGLNGKLGATTTKTSGTVLQLENLHGDTTLQLPLDTAVAPTVLDLDEYGNPRAGQQTTRYGWLGGAQRSDETLTGLTLMGVRLYNPATGRFLSVDPVPGGSANAYDYVNQDPVNLFDLDGRCIEDLCIGEGILVVALFGAISTYFVTKPKPVVRIHFYVPRPHINWSGMPVEFPTGSRGSSSPSPRESLASRRPMMRRTSSRARIGSTAKMRRIPRLNTSRIGTGGCQPPGR
ncbi:RHS repeat-associated protein [Streptomyces sp. TLI_235]|nr:RHS repeat-associated protein [Streptomyces sp. TLI_235]